MAKQAAKKADVVILLRNDAQHKDHPVEFTKEHAESLLALQLREGHAHYSLSKDSKLTFKDGHLIPSASNSTDTAAG